YMAKFKNRYRIGSARLKHWNYAWNGAYFITICTANRECFFGNIIDGNMHLSNSGQFAYKFWQEIPDHFPFVELDAFVVMPNHIHGIIVIDNRNDNVESLHCNVSDSLQCNVSTCNGSTDKSNIPNKNQFMSNISPKPGSVSTIIRSYKSIVTKHARKINPAFAWQSRFYDHIIRNDRSYERIKQYIIDNPKNWKHDKFY
ncbi:MAG: transposase, partial [bacterium]